MNVLFAMAHPYLPQFAGGVQSSTHELVTQLRKRSVNACVAAHLTPDGYLGRRGRLLIKLSGKRFAKDTSLGYPVYRTWVLTEAAQDLVRSLKPDVVVVPPRLAVGVALAFAKFDVPIVMDLRDVEFKDHDGPIEELRTARFIANSAFTARRYYEAYGIQATVIHPMLDRERYRTEATRRNVTMINPHPLKGIDLALEIAALCPDIPFSFVESWTLEPNEKDALRQRIARLGNAELRPRTNDMKSIFGAARIVLMPSQWDEAWGRVASEAQVSGIPVLASNTGGLPEAVGPGGMILGKDEPPQRWAEALRELWTNQALYDDLSAAAFRHAERPELDIEYQTSTFLKVLQDAVAGRPPSAAAT